MMSFFKAAVRPSFLDCRFLETQTYTEINQSKTLFGSGSNVYLQFPQAEANPHALLLQNADFTVLHDSGERFPAPKCHPHTRKVILEDIKSWAYDPSRFRKQTCFWLCGSVGSGKTAIAQTMAEEWHSRNRLGASCFISPPSPTTKNISAIIPAIAYQLALQFPRISPHLERAIHTDPLIFQKSISSQMARLIFDPLRKARIKRSRPKVVIIDGLEQYGDTQSEREIITALIGAIRSRDLPIIVLFTSRNEPHLTEAMRIPPPGSVHHVMLDTADTSADIKAYIRSRLFGLDGPLGSFTSSEEDVIQRLTEKCSSQFLCAAAITDYLSHPGGHPGHRLDVILGNRFNSLEDPFVEIDKRYRQILARIDEAHRSTVLDVLAWLVFKGGGEIHELTVTLEGNRTGSVLSQAGLEAILMLRPGMVYDCLINLHSILRVPRSAYEPIRVYHKSFIDFLAEQSRASPFFMDKQTASRHVIQCLHKHLRIPKSSERWTSLSSCNYMDSKMAEIHLDSSHPTDESKWGFLLNRFKGFCIPLGGSVAFKVSESYYTHQNTTPIAIANLLEVRIASIVLRLAYFNESLYDTG